MAADKILADGFRDASGSYLTEQIHSGVWLSDVPLDDNEGADGDALLLVVMPLWGGEADQFEWVQEPSFGYREWLFPSKLIKTIFLNGSPTSAQTAGTDKQPVNLAARAPGLDPGFWNFLFRIVRRLESRMVRLGDAVAKSRMEWWRKCRWPTLYAVVADGKERTMLEPGKHLGDAEARMPAS